MKWSMPYIRGPAGLRPLFWRDEQSGQLSAAVQAYLSAATSTAPTMPNDQFELFKAYCCYWVEAPCWKDCGDSAGLAEVRQAMKDATDVTALREALWRAGEFCLDQLTKVSGLRSPRAGLDFMVSINSQEVDYTRNSNYTPYYTPLNFHMPSHEFRKLLEVPHLQRDAKTCQDPQNLLS